MICLLLSTVDFRRWCWGYSPRSFALAAVFGMPASYAAMAEETGCPSRPEFFLRIDCLGKIIRVHYAAKKADPHFFYFTQRIAAFFLQPFVAPTDRLGGIIRNINNRRYSIKNRG